MRVLHTADLHLREMGDERWNALRLLVETAEKENVAVFAIAGDLFDRDIDAENLRPQLRKIFSECRFKTVIIPGNHDSSSYGPGLFFGTNVEVITDYQTPVDCGEALVWGMPFASISSGELLDRLLLLEHLLPVERKNLLLFHGELLDAFFSRRDLGDEGEQRFMPVRLSHFDNLNLDYVLAGHFHSRFDVRKLGGGGFFVYPGSPVSITRKETGRRMANLFEVGSAPHELPLDTPFFEEVNLELDPFSTESPFEQAQAKFAALHPCAKPIFRVGGFFNRELLNTTETELQQRMSQLADARCDPGDRHFDFRDVTDILEDSLIKSFLEKLDHQTEDGALKEQTITLAIKAMAEVKSCR